MTKIRTEVADVTSDLDTSFKVKTSNLKVTRPLWLVVLAGHIWILFIYLFYLLHGLYRTLSHSQSEESQVRGGQSQCRKTRP